MVSTIGLDGVESRSSTSAWAVVRR